MGRRPGARLGFRPQRNCPVRQGAPQAPRQARPVGFRLLPDEFTLGQLPLSNGLGKTFDKRNFRKKLFKTTLLIDLEKKADGKPSQHKGSQLFSFNKDKYQKMKIQGYDFLF